MSIPLVQYKTNTSIFIPIQFDIIKSEYTMHFIAVLYVFNSRIHIEASCNVSHKMNSTLMK